MERKTLREILGDQPAESPMPDTPEPVSTECAEIEQILATWKRMFNIPLSREIVTRHLRTIRLWQERMPPS